MREGGSDFMAAEPPESDNFHFSAVDFIVFAAEFIEGKKCLILVVNVVDSTLDDGFAVGACLDLASLVSGFAIGTVGEGIIAHGELVANALEQVSLDDIARDGRPFRALMASGNSS